MKIGIIGGTFDPVHNGHIHIARAAYEEYGLDRVWFMTAGDPYFKHGSNVTPPAVRLEMTELAVKEYPDMFESSDLEVKSEGHTYSSDTFTVLSEMHPDDQFFFIMGYDSLKSLDSWHRTDILLSRTAILCAMRNDALLTEAELVRDRLVKKYASSAPDIRFIHAPLMNISSTMIRSRVSEGLDISALVPKNVAAFIKEHNLYRAGTS